jgi:hypothetical protein
MPGEKTAESVEPVEPARFPEFDQRPAAIKVSVVGREVKMLRPICSTCQRNRKTVAIEWWKRCTHNPYCQSVEVEKVENVYEDEVVDEKPTGRKRLVRVDTFKAWEERPNWTQVSVNWRINAGHLVRRKLRGGFILPQDLRTPSYPAGIAPCCEYRDCFVQSGLVEYRWGWFCRKEEAQLVGHDARMEGGGGALEVGDNPKSLEKQARQLAEVPL